MWKLVEARALENHALLPIAPLKGEAQIRGKNVVDTRLEGQLATYLINLQCSQYRLQKMSLVLHRAGLEFERVEAVDGRHSSPEEFAEYNRRIALRRYGRPMSGPEVGCFLSHRRCVEAFLASSKQYALVFEDDIDLPAEFVSTLRQTIECLQETMHGKWDLVNLGNPPTKCSRPIQLLSNGSEQNLLQLARYFPLGTFALLWSRSGAERFLHETRIVFEPIDQFLRDWCVRDGLGFALSPELVSVDRSHSYIRFGWADRLSLNVPRYLAVKNWRLLKNNYRARKSWLADEDENFSRSTLTASFGENSMPSNGS